MSDKEDIKNFYAKLTPFYHLIYEDWEKSIENQAGRLNSIIKENWGANVSSILDVSCGIGTQTLGLAGLGYKLSASDLSPDECERAKAEAVKRDLEISFSVADMREAYNHHAGQFDLVISCDNSVPHLLTDSDILSAFEQFYRCTRPGGGCLISVRDYEKEESKGRRIVPYGTREENGVRYFIFQVWDFSGALYDLSMYFVEDRGDDDCITHVMRTKYYAVGILKLMALLGEAGFSDVKRLDGKFFQPVIIGTKKGNK